MPQGISYAALSGEQRGRLLSLVRHYEGITFAWAGPEARGQGHYYAVAGPTLLIEYDNTQNGANHIHSVVRDVTNDWDEDVLTNHYEQAHDESSTHTP